MGYQVTLKLASALTVVGLCIAGNPGAAQAQSTDVSAELPERIGPAAGLDAYYSSDADDTEVLRIGLNFDLRNKSPGEYVGIRVEKAGFNPLDQGWRYRERVYLRAADTIGAWQWIARVGTDGDTVLGSASINDEARYRKEFFIEREIVETPRGLSEGIYYTFAGAALDVPLSDRNTITLFAGVQDFTGENVRTHVRANAIHVIKPEWGLSAQLRGRYYRSSDPDEFDYYSPRWYAEVLPVLQVRRYWSGWRFLAAGGWGAQRDSETDWRDSRYARLSVTSPTDRAKWAFTGDFIYTNTPVTSGFTYSYFQVSAGITRTF
jgi:hypothetical protein